MSNKRLIISHIDLDGIGAILSLKYFNYDYDSVWFTNYDNYENGDNTFPYHQLKDYNEVIFTDFAPDSKCLTILEETPHLKFVIYDHHEKTYEDLKDYKHERFEYHYDVNKSGTQLVYEWQLSLSGSTPNFAFKQVIKLINTYDLWLSDDPLFDKAQDLNRLFWKTVQFSATGYNKYRYFIEKLLYRTEVERVFKFTKAESNVIKQERKLEQEMLKKAVKTMLVRVDNKGHKFAIIKLQKKVSIVAYYLLKNRTDLDYAVLINSYRPDELKVSLRSREFNLLQLEGSAGHREACGFETTQEFIRDLWLGKIYQIPYKENVSLSITN